jgi:hypothetical protein
MLKTKEQATRRKTWTWSDNEASFEWGVRGIKWKSHNSRRRASDVVNLNIWINMIYYLHVINNISHRLGISSDDIWARHTHALQMMILDSLISTSDTQITGGKRTEFVFKNNQLSSFLTSTSPIMTKLSTQLLFVKKNIQDTKKKLNCSRKFFLLCLSHLTWEHVATRNFTLFLQYFLGGNRLIFFRNTTVKLT